ncbi:MAG: tetratricopeptide repeat protein [Firmicutes bacterium]|jgi:tetratricopeptide (TPR) repeat protein|nr:tetratricopeptide repeat protein [Bacillota bacterium]
MSVMKTGKKKTGRLARRKIVYLIIALMLVGGLVLSATYGLFNYFFGGGKLAYQAGGDEYLYGLLQQAAELEKAVKKDPSVVKNKVELGDTFYAICMYYYMKQDLKEMETYAKKSRELYLDVLDEEPEEPEVTLNIALLALLEGDGAQAEDYFKKTLELEETNPDAHLYLGSVLYSRGEEEEAVTHWERALELAEDGSPVAQTAAYYLDLSRADENEEEGVKSENNGSNNENINDSND